MGQGKSQGRRPVPYTERRGWGEERALCRLRGSDSRPGSRARANRLRHLLTICRGVSSRDAITSLDRPSAASRTILARTTSQYGDVYLRAIASRVRRSSLERLIACGLFLGIRAYTPRLPAYQAAPLIPTSWRSLAAHRRGAPVICPKGEASAGNAVHAVDFMMWIQFHIK
jgi:hypothetical protein